MAKRFQKITNNEVMVKIEGAVGANTISLATDLLGPREALDGATQKVNISAIIWTSNGGTATITRNGVTLVALSGPMGKLTKEENFFEAGGNTFDIVITTSTAEVQIWLKLHKVGGYRTTFTPEQLGSYAT